MDEKPDWKKAGEHDPAFGPPSNDYQPACYQCRVDANKSIAGVKESHLCVPHLHTKIAALEAELAEIKRGDNVMEKIRFQRYDNNAYYTNKNEEYMNYSDDYYRAYEVDIYRAKVQRLVEAARDCSDILEAWKNNDKFSSIDEEAIAIVRNAIAEVISKKEDENGNSDKTI